MVCEAAQEVKDMIPVLLADPAEPPEAPQGVAVRAWRSGGVRHVLAVNGTAERKPFSPESGRPPVALEPGEHRFFILSGE